MSVQDFNKTNSKTNFLLPFHVNLNKKKTKQKKQKKQKKMMVERHKYF